MEKRPFIIDCDTGTDDAIAILAALYSPEVEVKAITSVNGNICERYVCRNNRNLTALLGKNVPVARGAVRPLLSGFVNEGHLDDTHGPTGFGTVQLPEAEQVFDPRVASELIYETAVEEKGALELLVIGPMTNIALALVQHGDLAGLIRHIWFMGGAAVGGNVTPTAEFNIWVDPEAAKIVIGSGIPMTMVGLDVTTKAIMTREDADALRACGTPAGQVAADLLAYMFTRNHSGGEDALMHDALAFAAAVCPDCLTCRDYFVDVETHGQCAYGHTFVDQRGRSGKPANVSVALEVDVSMFRKWLVDTICRSAGEK